MEQLKQTKIPFLITLFSILMLVFGYMTKDYNDIYYRKKKFDAPLEWYDVSLFGLEIDYKSYMLFFILVLGIGVYLLIFKTDEQIKSIFKFYKQNSSKVTELKENIELQKPKQVRDIKKVNESIVKIVEVVTLLGLFLTFYIGTSRQYSLWFFIILSYFYFLILKPKSMKQIVIKSILYPLIFLVIFTLAGSEDAYNWSSNMYFMSKHIIPFLISVGIIFFTQRHKLIKQPSFSFRSPLFWISMLCLTAAVLTLVVDYNI